MTKILSVLLMILFASGASGVDQQINTGHSRKIMGAACPAAPSGTVNQYRPDGSSCSGTCTNGAAVTSGSDLIGGNNYTEAHGGSTPVIYLTNQINGKAAWNFQGATCPSCWERLVFNSGIAGSGQWTFYVVANRQTAVNLDYFGGTGNDLQLYNDGSGNYLLNQQQAAVVITDGNMPANTWTAFGITWDFSANSGSIFTCSGGSCTTQATGSHSGMQGILQLGRATQQAPQLVAEVGMLNSIGSTPLASIGTYVHCYYGI